MDAFDQADSVVQLLSGLLGVGVMAFFAYKMFAGRKMRSSNRSKPGDSMGEVQGAAAGNAAPGSLDDARSRSQSLPDPQKKTVTGFAKWWLIFGMVANIGAALAPAAALTNSPAPGLVFMVMLLGAATAFGCYLLLRRNHFGLYVILIANTLAAFMNQIQVPGYTILVKTGLIPAILTYFVTRKQVPYPFGSGGRGSGEAPRETVEPASPEPAQIVDGAQQSTLLESGQPDEPNAAPAPSPAAPPSRREAAAPADARPRVTLPLAIAGAVVLLVCIISAMALAGAARTRSNDSIAPAARASSEPAIASARVDGKAATPESKAPAVVSPSVQLETKAGPVLIERAELLDRFPAGCSIGNPACNAAKDGYQLLVLWLARPGGGKISEVSADLFGEVINYLPAGSHDVYVTTADGSEAGLAAAQFPEGEFVLIFGLPQGAPSSLKLTWPGNRQLDISGLVQAGASQAPALADKNSSVAPAIARLVAPTLAPTRTPTRAPAATATPRPSPTAAPITVPTLDGVAPVSLAEALDRKLAGIQILGMGGASGASIKIVASALGNKSVSITVEPGTVLRSSVPGEQDMVVRRLLGLRQDEQRYLPAEVIFLPGFASDPQTYVVDAYCLNFHKDNPSATTSMAVDVGGAASPAVAAVLAAAGRVPGAEQDIDAIQAAVWTVTDQPTWQEMADRGYSPNRQMVAALLQSASLDQACAQLFGQVCTVEDCLTSNPTGLGGTRSGPCVSRQPGVTMSASAAMPTPVGMAATVPAPTTAPVTTTAVLDAQVQKLFAPGPDTAGIAVTGDAIWVADGEQKRIHRLDRNGDPVGSFQVKTQGEFRGLAWDGEALRLLVHDYQTGSQVFRLDGQGKVLSSFTVPADLRGLAWNDAGESLWTIAPGSDGFLLELDAGGELRQTLNLPVFGSMDGLAWAPDGLWVLSGFGKWHRFGFDGKYLASAELPMEVFAKDPALAWDPDGFLWVSVADTREIYQFALRQAEVDAELPSELRSSSEGRTAGQLPLPRPTFRALPGNTNAIIHVANGLPARLSVALDSASGGSVHESAVVAPGETWSAAIAKGGAFTLFVSANAAQPVAFYDKILLLAGYEYTWGIGDVVTVTPPPSAGTAAAGTAAPTAAPSAALLSSPTAVSPTAAPAAGSASPTRAATRPKPTAAPAAACPDLRARIIYPANGATISGVTNFLGTANVPDQAYYKFEYKPASSPTWQYLTQVDGRTVIDDKLMDFYTTTIAPGVYDFRLIAVDRSGNYPAPCEIRLTVQR